MKTKMPDTTGNIHNIRETQKFEESFTDFKGYFMALFEGANDAIIIIDDEKFKMCNKRTLELFGANSYDELIGKKPWEYSPELQPDGTPSIDRARVYIQLTIDGHPQRFFWKHLRSDGVAIDTEVSLSRIEIEGTEVQIQAIVRDVSDTLRNTRALKDRERVVHALLDSTADSAILIDSDLAIVELNSIAARRFGRDKDELIGNQVFDWVKRDVLPLRKDKINELLRTGEAVDYESIWKNRMFATSMYPILDPNGEIIQIAIIEKDISERRNALELLSVSEEKFQKAFYSNPLSVHITTFPEGIYLEVNPAFEAITGYSKEEIIGKSVLEADFYLQKSDRQKLIREIQKNGRLHNYEILFKLRSGEIRTCRLFSEIYEVHGQKQLITITNDITDQKNAEDALKSSKHRLKILFESAPDAIFLMDLKGRFMNANSACEEMTGYSKEALIGHDIIELQLISKSQKGRVDKLLADSKIDGSPGIEEFNLYRRDGSRVLIEISAYSVKIGEETEVLGIARDVSARKEVDQRIYRAVLEAEDKERISIAQDLHEGLGPLLSSTKLYIKAMESMKDPVKSGIAMEKSMETIDEAIDLLREISNNISPHILRNIGLLPSIRSLSNRISKISQIQIHITGHVNDRLMMNVETGLFRIVEELIQNTINHAKALNIEISINKSNGKLFLEYADDGIGFKVDKTGSVINGSGMESIKYRVRSMNGDIQFHSEIGEGMKVAIEVPVSYDSKKGLLSLS